MSLGILTTLWTVRVALAYYALAVAAWLMRRPRLAGLAWSTGLGFFLLHVAAAFATVHHWSHATAFAETARQSKALTGFDSGFGLWLNYLFALVWSADVIWLWTAPAQYASRSRWMSWAVHGFLLFMVVNGAIVFAHGLTRWVSSVGLLALLLAALYRGRTARILRHNMSAR